MGHRIDDALLPALRIRPREVSKTKICAQAGGYWSAACVKAVNLVEARFQLVRRKLAREFRGCARQPFEPEGTRSKVP